jgi:predicted GTPase
MFRSAQPQYALEHKISKIRRSESDNASHDLAADVPRIHISVVGFMHAGKSSGMNSISEKPPSIVDPSLGTTADTKSP